MASQLRIDLELIRKTVIIGLFADDALYDKLVLKGGNALSLVHGIGNRTSLDIDLSLAAEISRDELEERAQRALTDRFDSLGLSVFDFRLLPVPKSPTKNSDVQAGDLGYRLEFKLEQLDGKVIGGLDERRRQAVVLGPNQQRTFRVEISRNEYCAAKMRVEFDEYLISVYSPEMIAIEKLRALVNNYRLTLGTATRHQERATSTTSTR